MSSEDSFTRLFCALVTNKVESRWWRSGSVLNISKLTNIPSSRSAWKKKKRKMWWTRFNESDIQNDWHEYTSPRLHASDNNLDKYRDIEMDAGIDDYFQMVFLAIQTYYKRHFTFMRATPANLPNHFNHCTDSVGIVSASACYAGWQYQVWRWLLWISKVSKFWGRFVLYTLVYTRYPRAHAYATTAENCRSSSWLHREATTESPSEWTSTGFLMSLKLMDALQETQWVMLERLGFCKWPTTRALQTAESYQFKPIRALNYWS
jgi:hypothetical protein